MPPARADLAGRLRLCIGPGPAIASHRPEWVPRLAPGRRADDLPPLLGSLHSLCSQAHRLTARAAVAAARGQADAAQDAESAQALRLATARDQAMRLAHDWPRQLPGGSAEPLDADGATAVSAMLLRSCPLWRPDDSDTDRLAALPDWLAHQWLGMAPSDWLQRFDADPAGWPLDWARAGSARADRRSAWLPRLLGRQLDDGAAGALQLATPGPTPGLLDGAPAELAERLATLARALETEPGFWQAPHLDGQALDSGPWNRRHDPLRGSAATARAASPGMATAWGRLLARLVDLLRLADPGGETWLHRQALALDGRAGIAATEMARGVLLHWVRLDEDGQRVAACRVLAPTEWNFHPEGTLARALAGLDPHDAGRSRRAATRLAVAFDPCVDFDIAVSGDRRAGAAPREPCDA